MCEKDSEQDELGDSIFVDVETHAASYAVTYVSWLPKKVVAYFVVRSVVGIVLYFFV